MYKIKLIYPEIFEVKCILEKPQSPVGLTDRALTLHGIYGMIPDTRSAGIPIMIIIAMTKNNINSTYLVPSKVG